MSESEFERREHTPQIVYEEERGTLDIGAAATASGIELDRYNTLKLLKQTEEQLEVGNVTNFLLRARHDLQKILASFDN